ncbi:DUF2750 domain-containing protein [Acinetobacter populi]|jgi:hypothetical protein|uniref:DUF2750 domain-containing protein n=1 Tax=Acinetobacter populi TaxID=1582270 RepID=A0A1Z9YV20_9GAMM|nr:DUF2750 domain-containing protein [Acinetobacter populi]MCH4248979.1 DUF2750 domain-containing protein [Acinetobacter populi]OUY06068.1 hypothetical protein CAP51_15310 [Acinetobacter populi]
MKNPYFSFSKSPQSKSYAQDEQYYAFIEQIIQQQFLWGIATAHWSLCFDAGGQKAFPIWASEINAKLCCYEEWQDSKPQKIALQALMQEIIPYLIQHQYSLAINRTPSGEALFVDPKRLQEEIILG